MQQSIWRRPALGLTLLALAACQPPSAGPIAASPAAATSATAAAVSAEGSQSQLVPVAFSAAEIAAAAPVRALLERVVGAPVSQLELALVSEAAGQQAPDWYQLEVRDGKLYVSGNALTALSFGLYEYLRQTGAMSVSWEGNRIALPARFADAPAQRVSTLFNNRAYLNVCAYGYSTPWWDWTRWQQELDWMALHGVNNPVAMEGQEYIWQQLWREFGVSDAELSAYFSGPAFTPWQRMGNIEGHEGPLPASYIEKKRQLQKQILKQMQSFGMKPVVPAFSGYVPKQFTTLFPQAKISAMPKWSGFKHETYWLDPADPLFAKVAKRFIELYNAEYGAQQYYLLDAFNEMLPPVSKDSTSQRLADLAGYGAALYQSLAQVVPDATWVMQGWMFGSDSHFWDLPSIEAFLSKVPSDRLMVHDIGNDRFDVWQKAKGFYGKEWVFGFIHNYGASNPVYGDFDFYRDKVNTALHHADKGNLTGFGVFPEGIHSNSSAYEFMFDLAWQGQAADTNQWLQQYLHSRYGSQSPALYSAWHNIYKALFSTRYWEPRWWEDSAGAFLLMKRPNTEYLRYTGAPGNLALLDQALKALVALPPAELAAPLLQYDLVDFARHSATQHIDMLLQHTMLAYQQGKVAQGDQLQAQAKQLVLAVDALMAHTPAGTSRDTLYNWVAQARAYADNPAEAALYERNARQQVTVWGGSKLKDYASKAWHGMYSEFYWPRWQLMFAAQRAAALSANAAPFDSAATFDSAALEQQLIAFEQQWLDKPLGTPQPAPVDVVAAVAEIQALITASKAPPSNL